MAWSTTKFGAFTATTGGVTTPTFRVGDNPGPIFVEYVAASDLDAGSKLQRCLIDPDTEANWSDSGTTVHGSGPNGTPVEITAANMAPYLRLKLVSSSGSVAVARVNFSQFNRER